MNDGQLGDLVMLQHRAEGWGADSATLSPGGEELTVTAHGAQVVVRQGRDPFGAPVYVWETPRGCCRVSREDPPLAARAVLAHLRDAAGRSPAAGEVAR